MLLFRSITAGLLGACVYLLAQLGDHTSRVERVSERVPVARPSPEVSVIDVAHGVSPQTVLSLLRIEPGERIASVNDHEVASDPEAGYVLGEALHASPQYVDLTVMARDDTTRNRRLLILLH